MVTISVFRSMGFMVSNIEKLVANARIIFFYNFTEEIKPLISYPKIRFNVKVLGLKIPNKWIEILLKLLRLILKFFLMFSYDYDSFHKFTLQGYGYSEVFSIQ